MNLGCVLQIDTRYSDLAHVKIDGLEYASSTAIFDVLTREKCTRVCAARDSAVHVCTIHQIWRSMAPFKIHLFRLMVFLKHVVSIYYSSSQQGGLNSHDLKWDGIMKKVEERYQGREYIVVFVAWEREIWWDVDANREVCLLIYVGRAVYTCNVSVI